MWLDVCQLHRWSALYSEPPPPHSPPDPPWNPVLEGMLVFAKSQTPNRFQSEDARRPRQWPQHVLTSLLPFLEAFFLPTDTCHGCGSWHHLQRSSSDKNWPHWSGGDRKSFALWTSASSFIKWERGLYLKRVLEHKRKGFLVLIHFTTANMIWHCRQTRARQWGHKGGQQAPLRLSWVFCVVGQTDVKWIVTKWATSLTCFKCHKGCCEVQSTYRKIYKKSSLW